MDIAILILLGAAAAVAVILPLVRPRRKEEFEFADVSASPEKRAEAVEKIEAEVAVYRAAIRAGTLCERCGNPNAGGSRFCAECGRPLPLAANRHEPEAAS